VSVKSSINHLTSSTPLIVLVSVTKSSVGVFVADPMQRQNQKAEVRLGMVLSGKECVVAGSETVLTFSLPNGEFAGQTMAIECNL